MTSAAHSKLKARYVQSLRAPGEMFSAADSERCVMEAEAARQAEQTRYLQSLRAGGGRAAPRRSQGTEATASSRRRPGTARFGNAEPYEPGGAEHSEMMRNMGLFD